MKYFKDNKVYVQLKDLEFLFKYGDLSIPHSVYKKALRLALHVTEETMDEYIEFDQPKEVEFFMNIKYILDKDDCKNMTEEEYNEFILSSNRRINSIINKSKKTKKILELVGLRSKYRIECYKIASVKESRLNKNNDKKLSYIKK